MAKQINEMPKWPHDDTNSLIAFYGDPRRSDFVSKNLVLVKPPWTMRFDGKPIRGVQINRKCAASLKAVFDSIAQAVDNDWSKLPDGATVFDGSYNFRSVRGSSRLSCHAFGAAIDLDAANNPMNTRGSRGTMDSIVVDAFEKEGWFWGARFKTRQDPMHFQAAHEGRQVASLDDDFVPPMRDAHGDDDDEEAAAGHAVGFSSSISDAANTIGTVADTVGTVTTKAKPLFKSRIAGGAVALGASSTATAVAAAPPSLVDQFINVWKSPIWWLVVINICLTVWICYHYWSDHGMGALQRERQE